MSGDEDPGTVWTPGRVALHLLGLVLVVGVVWAGDWAYAQVGGWIALITQQPLRDVAEGYGVDIATLREIRAVVTDFRLLIQIAAVFLALSALDWLWRRLFARA